MPGIPVESDGKCAKLQSAACRYAANRHSEGTVVFNAKGQKVHRKINSGVPPVQEGEASDDRQKRPRPFVAC